MQPQLAKPFHRDGWVYEEKVDGWRILAVKRGAVVRLWNRIGRDHAERFPDVARAVAALPGRELVVDGEVAVFDAQLVSRFEYLTVAPPPELVITPPVYIAFDVLQVGAVICARGHSTIVGVRSRTWSTGPTCCPCGASPTTASRRGRWSGAATRAWSRRMRAPRTGRVRLRTGARSSGQR
jgi:hypothetical protein